MSKDSFSFNLLKNNKSARLGKINTHRGVIDTPAFMTVGTQGTIKSTFIEDVVLSGAQIILSNTYHLMIRPGTERIKRVGGLHQFLNCKYFSILGDFCTEKSSKLKSGRRRAILLPPVFQKNKISNLLAKKGTAI